MRQNSRRVAARCTLSAGRALPLFKGEMHHPTSGSGVPVANGGNDIYALMAGVIRMAA
ncbi:hypothetical protein [Desulfovibrio sp. MES5]|uniref:hypothetical protein n=1 Tax=Desulfovibrio sp. MES5 TaxID=1899016 RepID=UPI0025C00E7A|nr:hypothetical protein [Desulfovibrio sp. MES5]